MRNLLADAIVALAIMGLVYAGTLIFNALTDSRHQIVLDADEWACSKTHTDHRRVRLPASGIGVDFDSRTVVCDQWTRVR